MAQTPATPEAVATQPASDPSPTPSPTAALAPLSTVDIKSTPDGAEINVDDKFMGNTPSSLRLAAGDHKIKLEKSGFKTWERTMTVSVGATATLDATLEKQ